MGMRYDVGSMTGFAYIRQIGSTTSYEVELISVDEQFVVAKVRDGSTRVFPWSSIAFVEQAGK